VGLIELPPIRALLPIALASCLWYAFLTWAGVRLGLEWEAISRFIGHLNRSLAILAVLVAGVVGVVLWRRARARGPRRLRLFKILRTALGEVADDEAEGAPGLDVATEGAAALIHELTHADPAFTIDERGAIAEYLRAEWGLGRDGRVSIAAAAPVIADTQELATMVAERYDPSRRIALAERLYRIARRDGTLSLHEERLMLRVGDLLGLGPEALAEARRRASA
jgi:uncharacterized tellurite resistance protein B-like protein